ncbi:hypothetical protein IW145_006593, partial [Coemansia sp. RSA 521]
NAADIECQQPLLASSRENIIPDSDPCSLSTSPTALDIRRPSGTSSVGHKAMCTNSTAAKLDSRVETLRQICNGLVWLVVAESLVHTMLNFALRQELTRSQQPDARAIRLSSWLAFAQICIAVSWTYQLRHRYAASSKRRAASVQQSTLYSWTASRECFWLLSLIASTCELYAYIACGLSPLSAGSLSPLHSTMLRTLISIRLALNAVLVGCAVHGAYLGHRHRTASRDVSANYSSAMPRLSAGRGSRKPRSDSDDDYEAAVHSPQPPQLCRADTTAILSEYGATSSS